MSSSEDDVPTEAPAPALESLLPRGTCPPLYLSYGLASLKGRLPALTDALAAVPSFTALSPSLGLDYFGVFDGHFGAAAAIHLMDRLYGTIAEVIEREMQAEIARFIHGSRGDVEGWWRTAIVDAFRAVDEEVLGGGVADAAAVGATALVALVLKEYVVLANCGVSRAVISRGGEAVQPTTEHRGKLSYDGIKGDRVDEIRYILVLRELDIEFEARKRTMERDMAATYETKRNSEIRIFESSDEMATDLAEYISQVSEISVKERRYFAIALSGGPLISFLGKLCEAPYNKTLDWSKWYIFWSDERVVAKNHVDSNYKLAKEGFLSKQIGCGQICLGSGHVWADLAEGARSSCPARLDPVSAGVRSIRVLAMFG